MSMLGNLFLRFNKQVETSDHQKDKQLKTHYYKATFNQLFQSVEQILQDDADCQVTTVAREHGEIAAEVRKPIPCFLIATVVSVKPMETAVDFTISTDKFVLSGAYPLLTKRIASYYQKLGNLHKLNGIKEN